MQIVLPSELIKARTCYRILAGNIGIAIRDGLINHQYVTLGGTGKNLEFFLSDKGKFWSQKLGVSLSNRVAIKTCIDYSHKQLHMSGPWAMDMCKFLFAHDFLQRSIDKRSVVVTNKGRNVLHGELTVSWQV